jgi:hypothetical protein
MVGTSTATAKVVDGVHTICITIQVFAFYSNQGAGFRAGSKAKNIFLWKGQPRKGLDGKAD